MRINNGRSTDRRGVVLLGLIVLLTGAAVAAGLYLSDRSRREREEVWNREEESLATLVKAFRLQVASSGTIPGPDGWASTVAQKTGMSSREIEYSHAPGRGFAGRRLFLVDPALRNQTWPVRQLAEGLLNASNLLLQSSARVIWVSSTHPALALPVTNGTLNVETFESLWNWSGGPGVVDPPTGWPSAWRGNGGHLHVARLPIASLFAKVEIVNLKYLAQVGSLLGLDAEALRPGRRRVGVHVLKGSTLRLSRYTGSSYQVRVVTQDDALVINRLFSFGLGKDDLDDWLDRLRNADSRYSWLMYLQATDIDNDEDWDLWSRYAGFRRVANSWGLGNLFGNLWSWDTWLRNSRSNWAAASDEAGQDEDDDWVWDEHDCDDWDWDAWVNRARNRWGDSADADQWKWDGVDWNGWFRKARRGRR